MGQLISTARVPNFWDLMPHDLRWSWWNNRNKTYNRLMHLNHPQTILPPPSPFRFMKKLSSMKLVPGAQKIGDHCSTTLAPGSVLHPLWPGNGTCFPCQPTPGYLTLSYWFPPTLSTPFVKYSFHQTHNSPPNFEGALYFWLGFWGWFLFLAGVRGFLKSVSYSKRDL